MLSILSCLTPINLRKSHYIEFAIFIGVEFERVKLAPDLTAKLRSLRAYPQT